MSTPTSTSFCILPWMHLFADEGGAMFPCCSSLPTRRPNIDEAGRVYRVGEPGDLEAAWNSGYMRQLRLDMLAGRRPVPCNRCYMYDDLNMRSSREDANAEHAARIEPLVAQTTADGSVPLDLRTVDLRLGNLCNLRCRMCSPQSSRALIGEYAEAYGLEPTHRVFDAVRAMNWFERDEFWELFERLTPRLESLHFAGGEPMLVPQMFAFLSRLVSRGRAASLALGYTTNLTVLPDAIYELWPHFRSVRVMVSIDGYAEVNSFIRHPSDWATLDRHLARLEHDYERLNLHGGILTNTTVQIFNVLRLGDLLDYLARTRRRAGVPTLSVLTHPRHFSIQALPLALKEEAARRLAATLASLDPHWPAHWATAGREQLQQQIDGLSAHMMEKDQGGVLPGLRRWTAIQDAARGQRVLDVLPELAPVFDGPAASGPPSVRTRSPRQGP